MLLLFLPFARLVKLVQLNASLVNANFLLRERGMHWRLEQGLCLL